MLFTLPNGSKYCYRTHIAQKSLIDNHPLKAQVSTIYIYIYTYMHTHIYIYIHIHTAAWTLWDSGFPGKGCRVLLIQLEQSVLGDQALHPQTKTHINIRIQHSVLRPIIRRIPKITIHGILMSMWSFGRLSLG